MSTVTLQRIEINSGTDSFLVRRGESILGIVERIKGCRVTRNPWKAYAGHGESLRYLGACYPTTWDRPGWAAAKDAAVEVVVSARMHPAGDPAKVQPDGAMPPEADYSEVL